MNQKSPARRVMFWVIGICFWALTLVFAFYGGSAYPDLHIASVIEVEVTREVVQPVEVFVEVTREVEVEVEMAMSAEDSEAADGDMDAEMDADADMEDETAVDGEEEMAEAPDSDEEMADDEEMDEAAVDEEEEMAEETAEEEVAMEVAPLEGSDLALFLEVWGVIENSFDGDLPTVGGLNEAMFNAAVETLDGDAPDITLDGSALSGDTISGLEVEDLAPFFETWNLVQNSYEGEMPDLDTLNEALVNAGLGSLNDEYTRYVNPDVAARFREDLDGTFEGIGAFVGETDDGFIEIIRPISGQPAEAAGLLPNDLIIEVDGEDVTGQTIDEVITKVRGPRGTDVTLGIQREGEEELLQITITRARVEIPVVETELLDNGLGYIRLTSFNAVAVERLTAATSELEAQGVTGLILDLRDNPGGLLDAAIGVTDLYLPEGVILYERGSFGIDRTFTAETGQLGEEIPMVVLVNGGSASASELVALALRDNDRATLIGERTFGKGSVQQLNNLSNGGELRVTIARWYSPLNETISNEGVEPDIEVILDLESNPTLAGEGDTQFDRAVEFLLNGE